MIVPATEDDFAAACEAYRGLIAAFDRLYVSSEEISMIASAIEGLLDGQSFSLTVKSCGSRPYESTVTVDY